MSFMDIFASIITGGATGLLGTAISGVTGYFKNKQKMSHQLALMDKERELLALEAENTANELKIKGETARDVADAAALTASYADSMARMSDGQSRWIIAVDVVRGLTRPLLTVALVGFMVSIWVTTDDPVLEQYVVSTGLYLATAAVLWWFGSRASKAPQMGK